MAQSDTEGDSLEKETDPALPKASKETGDQISKVIGNVGRWQLEKILLVFLASAPGTEYLSSFKLTKFIDQIDKNQ